MKEFRPQTVAAINAVRDALALATRGTGKVHTKLGRDIVTDSDIAVEDHIRASLTAVFEWPVVGEERGGEPPTGTPYWLVDPICGTRNFASGLPLFAVNTALVEEGRVTASVVGDGLSGDLLVTEAGSGAWRVHGQETTRLSTSVSSLVVNLGGWPKAGSARNGAALALARVIAADTWDIRCLATTLALGYVATGQFAGCVLFSTPDPVHFAAGSLLVVEAGGCATDAEGRPWVPGAGSLVCGANEVFQADLLSIIAPGSPH
ncbi:MAG TPA: inositol monophosphatase [Acidimicrobiales bacterium]|nr:inositol monophosphatase [Acidimicrobiales bacterium]